MTLNINPPSSTTSFETSSSGAAVAAVGIASSNQEIVQEKATQVMHTDNNGNATFTVGPKSDLGVYDTELEVTKDSYQSSFEQIDFHVVYAKPHNCSRKCKEIKRLIRISFSTH